MRPVPVEIGAIELDSKDFSFSFPHVDTPLSEEQVAHVKKMLYRAGKYTFKVPPVRHEKWTEDDWIRYIDRNGGWIATPVSLDENGNVVEVLDRL